MALCRFIYGVIKIFLCFKHVVHVRYVSIDDLVMTAPLTGGAGKARFNVATPTCSTVTCTAYVLLYNLQTKSI